MTTNTQATATLQTGGAALIVALAVTLAGCGGGQKQDLGAGLVQSSDSPATQAAPSRTALAAYRSDASPDPATAEPSPTLTDAPTIAPPATATPSPAATATSEPPTPTSTPILELSLHIVGDCQFDPPLSAMKLGGSVTFVNTTGSEIQVAMYLPNDNGIDGQGIEPGETSAPFEVNVPGRTVLACDIAGRAETTFGALVVTG